MYSLNPPINPNYMVQQPPPQGHSWIENVPLQKFYTDYQPEVTHEQIPYDRTITEDQVTALGNVVPVTKTITDYQTVQHITYKQIEVPYTDYQQIEHRVDYVPEINYETYHEDIPQQKIQHIVQHNPMRQTHMAPNGQLFDSFVNNSQIHPVPTLDYLKQQRVHKRVQYRPVQSSNVVKESTVQKPVVTPPQNTDCVVQKSVHDPLENHPMRQSFNGSQIAHPYMAKSFVNPSNLYNSFVHPAYHTPYLPYQSVFAPAASLYHSPRVCLSPSRSYLPRSHFYSPSRFLPSSVLGRRLY